MEEDDETDVSKLLTPNESVLYTLHTGWSSITYHNIHGVCELRIPANAATQEHFTAEVIFSYSTDSKFRPNVSKSFKLNAIRGDTSAGPRVVMQTDLTLEQQLMLTFTFDKPAIGGFYSMIVPIDCGALKPMESKAHWKAILGL